MRKTKQNMQMTFPDNKTISLLGRVVTQRVIKKESRINYKGSERRQDANA